MTELAMDQKLSPLERSPKLTRRGLTILLVLICTIPVVTILALHYFMPEVHQGQLEARISLQGVPPDSYYELPREERAEIDTAAVVIKNVGDVEWTNFYVRVNRHYNIYDNEPIPPGATRTYMLNRFIARIGAVMDIRQVQVKHVEIYARVPRGARYTYDREF